MFNLKWISLLLITCTCNAQLFADGGQFESFLWNFENDGQAARWEKSQTNGTPGADIHLLDAWKINDSAPEVVIAVIDSGFNLNHPDLSDEFQKRFAV